MRTRNFLIGALVFAAALVSAYLYSSGMISFGAGYRPVTGYEARLTSFLDDVTASTTINVNTTQDRAGNEITLASVTPSSTPRVYFTLEPGTTREEIVACTGKSTNQWTSCVRGLDFQGGNLTASSTLAKDHNAGAKIIMSNVGQFYGEYVSITGAETLFAVKTFDSFPRTTSTSATPITNADFATKYYVDNTLSTGFSSANVSSTLGLQAITTGFPACQSSATCVGVFASSTASKNGGFMNFSNAGRLIWDVVSFLAGSWTWAGVNTFSSIVATSTPDNLQVVGTPDTTSDALNLGSQVQFYATGTSGVPITAGESLRMGGDSSLYLTNANATNTVYEFVGIALNTVSGSGQTVRYVRPGGIFTSSTSLFGSAVGHPVYLSDSNGDFAAITQGTVPANIGLSISANALIVKQPTFFATTSSRRTITIAGTAAPELNSYNTTWTPKRVRLTCSDADDVSHGEWNLLSSGASSTFTIGNDFSSSNTSTCMFDQGASPWTTLTVTTSTGGFAVWANRIGGGATVVVDMVAETW